MKKLTTKTWRAVMVAFGLAALPGALAAAEATPLQAVRTFPNVPKELLRNADHIPDFWVSEVDAVNRFLAEHVKRGKVEQIGHTAGGRPIMAVGYGEPRRAPGTTTFSGGLGFFDIRAYLGPDYAKKVFIGLGGVHGGEFEGIVGMVNLIAVLETGRDLRGKEWPQLTEAAKRIDRIVIVPIVNVDGRARIPLRMEPYNGTDNRFHEYFNTGVWANGESIGWPTVKEFIPLDFGRTQFPGGYPNDAGVNLQHDDFLGARQPETQALLDLCAREKPDLYLNMHTGAPPENYYMRVHRPATEQKLTETFDALYREIHTALALAGLQGTRDPEIEAKPPRPARLMNLETALNLHCGVLGVLIEAPSHSFAGHSREGKVVKHSPEMLLDAELVASEASLRFLAEKGGRSQWAPK
ncbi:MAG TPA: M14 family zinc carboxypeptidase [Opitutaceae bacterium]|nr:M14 family zinc carboxypeptidase [Opitutaceae bacterium]